MLGVINYNDRRIYIDEISNNIVYYYVKDNKKNS